MKKETKILLFFILISFVHPLKAFNFKDKVNGLEIASKLMYNGERLGDYTIIIYGENQSNDTIVSLLQGTVFLYFEYNKNYTVRYIKKGFHDRLVVIDTHLDLTKKFPKSYFDYEIEMLIESKENNTLLDLPVGLVHYDITEKRFMYSRYYHRQIRKKEITEVGDDD